jgi:ketosteroid isomerase-like protein
MASTERPPSSEGERQPCDEGDDSNALVPYTRVMGAVETMEDFFERLNTGDREGAVALMDEATEMRVHVGDSVQTYRGIERVGGWFLRGDKGLRMIPGDVRDTGNTYEADIVVVRPGAPSQHLDATFRVEAGKITSINLAPR